VRRDPEAARALILDAAETIFAARGPDAVGLKDVAKAAGVSHALVTHYFGTFDGLVEAALERRAALVRQQVQLMLAAEEELRPGALLDRLWEAAQDPITARLGAWALLSGRAASAQFFPRRVQGLKLVVDALEKRMRARRGGKVARAELERVVTMAVAFTLGYALTRKALQASLGRDESAEDDAELRRGFVEMVEGYLSGRR
jgi:AcrR family transcriptional regulator